MQVGIHTELTEALEASHPSQIAQKREDIAAWGTTDTSTTADTKCPYYTGKQGGQCAPLSISWTETATL